MKNNELEVNGRNIRFIRKDGIDFVCITDIAAIKNPLEPKDVIKNWMRSRSTLSFLGLWEKLNNPEFKGVEFDPLLAEAGENAFTMSRLSNMENINSVLINEGVSQPSRLMKLNAIAIQQMQILSQVDGRNLLK